LMLGVPFAHGSVIFRKSFLTAKQLLYGQTEEIVAEDKALWQDFYNNGAIFGNINEALFRYRSHDSSLSNVKKKLNVRDNMQLRNSFVAQNDIELFAAVDVQYTNRKSLLKARRFELIEVILYLLFSKIILKKDKTTLFRKLCDFSIFEVLFLTAKTIRLKLV